jgi:putative chitinase
MIVTAANLEAAVGCHEVVAERWAPHIAAACDAYDITSAKQLAAFLAQVGHESQGLARTSENLNYGPQGLLSTWPSRFDRDRAGRYARQPERIANYVYANRLGNGNEASGDGFRYRGRGLLQVTGRANYEAMSELLLEKFPDAPDLGDHPELLEQPKWAARSAAAYWSDHDLNALAEAGAFDAVTQRINGGSIGLQDRRDRYQRAKRALA